MHRSAILAVAGVAAILVVVGAAWFQGVDVHPGMCTYGGCPPSASPPIGGGPPLSLSTPTVAHASGTYWYNFSVDSAAPGLTLGGLAFQVVDPSGIPVPTGLWSVTAVNVSHAKVGTYLPTSGAWTTGSSASLTTHLGFGLVATVPLAGYTFLVLGTPSGFHGSVTATIP